MKSTQSVPPTPNIPRNNPAAPDPSPSALRAASAMALLIRCRPPPLQNSIEICVSEKSVVAALGGHDPLALPSPPPLLDGRTTRLVDVHTPGLQKELPSVSEIGEFRRL